MNIFGYQLLCRWHRPCPDGFGTPFDRGAITVFFNYLITPF